MSDKQIHSPEGPQVVFQRTNEDGTVDTIRMGTQFPEGWKRLVEERDRGKGPLARLEEKHR